MSAAALSSLLPQPRFTATVEDAQDDSSYERNQASSSSSRQVAVQGSHIPSYGRRQGWRPSAQEDFGDGGSYPECHVAQYPLEMGRKRSGRSGGTLTLQMDSDGNVRYDAIVQQGRSDGQRVQSQHKDLVPLSQRSDSRASDLLPDRPDAAAVAECAARTRAALEKIINSKIATAAPTHVEQTGGSSSYIRYTPGQQGANGQQRIIKMTEKVQDPLEPPKWKSKGGPRRDPSPPPPVLRSPPRKVTREEQAAWTVPPSISNWKNNRGYTIPLDKRLAADGRGMQDVHINDGFAQFSEALNLAERHAREEVRQRSQMQQKIAAKDKARQEEHLRAMAQRAREERSGLAPSATPSMVGGDDDRGDDDDGDRLDSAPVHYSSRRSSRSRSDSRSPSPRRSRSRSRSRSRRSSGSSYSASSSEDDESARERDRLRAQRRRERERELRMSSMGQEQRAKQLLRDQNRDISEKVALGLAKPTAQGGEIDARLFNQEKFSSSFGDEGGYNAYDKPLFSGSSAANAIYSRPARGDGGRADDEAFGGGTTEGVSDELSRNDRFGLGRTKAFSGAGDAEAGGPMGQRDSGPVLFERDTSSQQQQQQQQTVVNDPFQIDQFLEEAKRGGGGGADKKRQGLYQGPSGSKRAKGDD